ncbi:hypothetical protein F443_22430 [Phytophthora nicotianae P1569]|uniref:Uncharacterized protein n=1 Tax=Phytophthora nicotianae P1569 TaxID=1317065 RepID=V9DVY1_PHYNI|nr:hypothetical protein F443_22430 [Phytophthora nicotianae P1569]
MEMWLTWVGAAELREVTGRTNYWALVGSAVAGIVVWVVITPLRNVSWAFLDSVVESGMAAYFFAYTCGDRYLEAARNADTLALPPLELRVAIWDNGKAVPKVVHQSDGGGHGGGGRKDGRLSDGGYLAVSVLLCMVVYLPRLVYESVEGVLGGPIGVGLAVFMVNVYFEFAMESCYWSMTVLVTGCYSHGLHYCWACRPNKKTGLGSNTKREWDGLAGTPTKTRAASVTSDGTSTYGVPEADVGKTARPSPDGAARWGRRGSVGENCHGLQLDGGLAILADCIQKVCSLQGQRATSLELGPKEQTAAFHV